MVKKTLNELAHLEKYVRPDFTVDPDAFFDILKPNKLKIVTYLKKTLNYCIIDLKNSKNISCTAKINQSFRITGHWRNGCLLKSYNFRQKYAGLKENDELVARGFLLEIKCNKNNTQTIIDNLFENFFSKVNNDYPIYPVPKQQYVNSLKESLLLDFIIIYPKSSNEEYCHLPLYNPNTFVWPNYSERFQIALNEISSKKPNSQTREMIKQIIEDWEYNWRSYKNYQHPNVLPDRWVLMFRDENAGSHYYMRGSDEEIEGLKLLIQCQGLAGTVAANDWESDFNDKLFQKRIGEKSVIKTKEITDPQAQFENGVDYELFGDGKKAKYWYSKAAEQGKWQAMYGLALLHYNGDLVEKDYSIALKWFTKSADEDDDGCADFFLGEMYANGYGVEQDLNKAKYWYSRAADKGHDEALKTINKLGLEYDDTKRLEKKEHQKELERKEDEKRKLEEVEEWEREIQEKELELKSEYPKLLKYFNAEEYSQPDYEIDLSAFYTSKHADGKPIIDEIVNQQLHKCCNRFGLFDDSENGQNCFLSAGSDSYFNTPRLLNTFRLTKKYNKINDTGKLLIRTFDLDIELDNFDSSDLPKAKEAISLFLKEINKDYPCFIERYSRNYHVWYVDDFDENDRIFIVIGIIYPAEYEETPLILPTENQTIEPIDSIRLIDACRDELLANRKDIKAILDANNIKGTRSITDYKTDITKRMYNYSFSNIGDFESEYCYSDRGCVMNANLVLSYFMRGSIEEKNAIKTSLLLGYNLTIVGYRNAKFDREDLLNGNYP